MSLLQVAQHLTNLLLFGSRHRLWPFNVDFDFEIALFAGNLADRHAFPANKNLLVGLDRITLSDPQFPPVQGRNVPLKSAESFPEFKVDGGHEVVTVSCKDFVGFLFNYKDDVLCWLAGVEVVAFTRESDFCSRFPVNCGGESVLINRKRK